MEYSPTRKIPSLTLSLGRDVMKALVSIGVGTDENENLLMEDIVAAGTRLSLKPERFNPESLAEVVDRWNKDRVAIQDYVVAESFSSPKTGTNGRIEWLVKVPWSSDSVSGALPVENQSAVNPASKRDMRDVNAILAVEAKQPLLRLIPPGKGVPGEDLLGRITEALDGKPVDFRPGINIDESPQEPGLFVARTAGFLRSKDGRPEVQECFFVNGNVDYSTGNIKYERSAHIRGDVQDGFGITVGGDLEVGGTVGDCRLITGGAMVIRGGFQGKGQGLILTKGPVVVGFGSNQIVKAYGSVEVMKEAYNMQVFTRETLLVHGPIVGGRAVANTALECASAGNEHGTPTSLEVGCDFVTQEGLQEVETRLKEYGEAQSRFHTRLGVLKEAYRNRKSMEPELARELVVVRQALEKLAQAIPILQSRRTLLSENLKKGMLRLGLQIRIEKQVYAGVTIRMGNEHVRLSENLAGPRRFVYEDFRIKIF